MAQLAIKGHATRGKEVIQLLKMLGGENAFNLDGTMAYYYYYIDNSNNKIYHCLSINPDYCIVFTLEEFNEKFPYKVDDIVVSHKYGKGFITQMLWIDNEIVYEIEFEDCVAYCKANELQRYDAFKGLLLQELTEYLSHATREELDKTMNEIEIALAPFKVGDKVIVKGYEKMGEDEVILVFKTYDGDIKYKTKNHLDTHYFMEDSFTRVEKINKAETMELTMKNKSKLINIEPKLVGNECVHFPIPLDMKLEVKDGMCYLYRDCGEQCKREGVNLQKMERKLDEALEKETTESLNKWLNEEPESEPKAPILSNRYDYTETKTLKLVEPKFKVGDKITMIDGSRKGEIFYIDVDKYHVAVSNNIGIDVFFEDQDDWELVPNKFNINDLKPFDKVLVRDTDTQEWCISFFSHCNGLETYKYSCINNTGYAQCVPYEGNEHLLGTTNDCDEFYKAWEE